MMFPSPHTLPLLLLLLWTRLTRAITNDFVPLSCNSQLSTATCVSWVTTFGTGSSFTGLVQIPCGTCVLMDHPGPTISFLSGLDIIGKLVFPNTATYKITIYATSITVQGELDLQSTLTPVTATPNIRVIMIGQSDTQVFRPVGENSGACPTDDLFGNCRIGRKAITVAGGKVTLRGIPADTPTWVKLYDVTGGTANNPTALIVPATVSGKWAVGAEVLITSHTRDWFDQQVRTITSVATVPSLSSYVQLNLNTSFRRPTTQRESLDYAVEVALLSRNILFEGGTAKDDGGHFWILATPNVVQVVEGIEFVQFGQQGKLGRYPIHYHFSSNAIGSKIVKNSIHQSHQRCIVIHGTNNVLVQENIAYDTKGHCFMLEDGIETGNVFNRNLGALTGNPDVIIPDNDETDMQPATFWISNPTNYFSGNIAAGSNSSGFWFELKKRGPRAVLYPSPEALPLGSFTGNVAHSNVAAKGAFRMYPGGYRPLIANKATLTDLKAYRNFGRGMYIHICHNLDLTNSLFADNDISVDVDRAEAIGLYGLRIVGKSDSFAALIAREPSKRDICNRARGRTIGIDIHTYRPQKVDGIVTIKNIDFVDFDDVTCPGVAPVIVDSETQKQGIFELFTTFENVVAVDGAAAVDFCEASAAAIDTVYLIDLDGSFRPNRVNPTTASSLVSSGTKMMTFLESSQCTAISGRCYNYCADTCFRSVQVEVDPKGTENFLLKVCERSSPTKCVSFSGGLYYDINLIYSDIPRLFFAHLPEGIYDAVFLNGSGVESWPSFAKVTMEPALCSASVQMTLREPPVTSSQCQQLIRNGNADASSTEPMFWLSALGGLRLLHLAGVGGSNAVAGTKQGTTQLFQYVDNRCLTTGAQFIVSADIKLLDVNGTLSSCLPSSFDCPTVGIFAESALYTDIAEVNATVGANGFQRASGILTVDPFVATSPAVYFYVKSTRTRQLVVDNFSVVPVAPIVAPVMVPVPLPAAPVYNTPVTAPVPLPVYKVPVPTPVTLSVPLPVYKAPLPTPVASPKAPVPVPKAPTNVAPVSSCSNLIRNSDMALGFQGYWSGSYASAMKNVVNQTSAAIQHSANFLSSASGGPSYNAALVNTTCMTPGSSWEVSVNVRLILPFWRSGATCNLARSCPNLRVLIRNTLGSTLVSVSSRSYTSTPWKTKSYNTLKTNFTFPASWSGRIGTMIIGIRGYSANMRDLVFDDFYIRRI